MADSRRDEPLQQETKRSVWIGISVQGLSLVAAYFLGGNFLAYLVFWFSWIALLRGCQPGWFARHFDRQIISGTPYHRKESVTIWVLALGFCLALAILTSWLHGKIFPEKPDFAKSPSAKEIASLPPRATDNQGEPIVHIEPEHGALISIGKNQTRGEYELKLRNSSSENLSSVYVTQRYFFAERERTGLCISGYGSISNLQGTSLKAKTAVPIAVQFSTSNLAGQQIVRASKVPHMFGLKISVSFQRESDGKEFAITRSYGTVGDDASILYTPGAIHDSRSPMLKGFAVFLWETLPLISPDVIPHRTCEGGR
jgi:hypothetical protein